MAGGGEGHASTVFPSAATAMCCLGRESQHSATPGLFLHAPCTQHHPAAPARQVAQVDLNNDGLVDVIDFSASVTGPHPVHGVKALLQFTYSLSVRPCPSPMPPVWVPALSVLGGGAGAVGIPRSKGAPGLLACRGGLAAGLRGASMRR